MRNAALERFPRKNMTVKKSNLSNLMWIIVLSQIAVSCIKDKMPYEDTFKRTVIANTKIEPIVESITVDSRLESIVLKQYFARQLAESRSSDKAEAKIAIDKAIQRYDQAKKMDGKYIADEVYLRYVTEAKEKYDRLEKLVNDSVTNNFYFDRLIHHTIFEEITVKFRLAKHGSLLVERYRTDIFKADTSFYELKTDETIQDYIK
jgi:hypothetical protein